MTTPTSTTDTTDTTALDELRRVYLAIYNPEPGDDLDMNALYSLTASQLADAIISLHQALNNAARAYAQAVRPSADVRETMIAIRQAIFGK